MLQPVYMPEPTTDNWLEVARGFERRWQFPHCCGAIDGNHVVIQAPPRSGSVYHNYKGTFSIVLLAVVDHDYCFSMVDVGSYGCNSDSGVFSRSAFGKRLYNGTMNIPPASPLIESPELGDMPYCLVGDEAFPLTNFLIHPYPGRGLTEQKHIFNYRLSRARRFSENALGIQSNQWRIYRRVINIHHVRVDNLIKATVIIHNFLRKTGKDI